MALVYTFSCGIVLAQGLEFTRMNFVPFFVDLLWVRRVICGPEINEDAMDKQNQNRACIQFDYCDTDLDQHLSSFEMLLLALGSNLKAQENEVKVLTKS